MPASSCVLLDTAAEALAFPRGDIRLTLCSDCGFIFNAAFDPALTEYSARYEETQGFSPTFNRFQAALAERLIERHGLRGKTIVEIGCGKGEFLRLICRMGDCQGLGFDPSYDPRRGEGDDGGRVAFVQDLFTERQAGHGGDCICCKMTLEHIPDVNEFTGMVRRTIASGEQPVVFFQVPDTSPILRHAEFWDVYYEHCSYFTPTSLATLFARNGFELLDLWTDYGDQYLMIEARPQETGAAPPPPQPKAVASVSRLVNGFAAQAEDAVRHWQKLFANWSAAGQRVAVWGSGSKAVAFLTALGVTHEVACVVDINPHRHGKYMPGIGHPIVSPEALREVRPDRVVVMNPVYVDEIATQLASLGLTPEISAVTAISGVSESTRNAAGQE